MGGHIQVSTKDLPAGGAPTFILTSYLTQGLHFLILTVATDVRSIGTEIDRCSLSL